MKTPIRAISTALAVCGCLATLTAQGATVPELLFKTVAGANVLSDADKTRIAALLPLAVGPNGLTDNLNGCRGDSQTTITVRDLNGDGRAEVIVADQNGCLYGMSGGATYFLASDAQGNWREIMRGDGTAYEIRPSSPGTWPAILPGVMGFCYPIYGYSEAQKKYLLTSRVADTQMPNACKNFGR